MANYSEDESSDEKSRDGMSSNEIKTFVLRTDGAGEPAAEAPASNIGGEVYLQTEPRDPDVKTTISSLDAQIKSSNSHQVKSWRSSTLIPFSSTTI